MDFAVFIEIIKIAIMILFVMDSAALLYVWAWKEYHYGYKILFFPIPFTGIIWLCSDYEKTFKEISEKRNQNQLIS